MVQTLVHSRTFANSLHAIFLAFPVALYPAALVTDITYLNTAVIQWTNFSSWLIAGADLFAGIILAWAILGLFFGRARHRRGRGIVYLGVVAVMFVAGILNAFQHARDGWHSVGTFGLVGEFQQAVERQTLRDITEGLALRVTDQFGEFLPYAALFLRLRQFGAQLSGLLAHVVILAEAEFLFLQRGLRRFQRRLRFLQPGSQGVRIGFGALALLVGGEIGLTLLKRGHRFGE